MPPHEHLLYLVLHAYKHFVRSGIGARQFCGIGLWARAYHSEIDWQRLHEQCESVHAATFAAAAFRIARDDLGIEFDLYAPWSDAVDAEPLLHDSLCGGVYGSNDLTRLHSSTVTLNAVKANRTGEKSGALRKVFPKHEYLERRYPYLKSARTCCRSHGRSASRTTRARSNLAQAAAPPAPSSSPRSASS